MCQELKSKQANELKATLLNRIPGASRLKTLHQLGTYYQDKQHDEHDAYLDSAVSCFKQALTLAETLPYDKDYGVNESLLKLARACFANDNIIDGKKYYLRLVNSYHAKRQPALEAETLLKFGSDGTRTRMDPLEIDRVFKRSLAIYKKLGDNEGIIMAGHNIAENEFRVGHFEEAKRQCMLIISKYQHTRFKTLCLIYSRLSWINRYQGNLDKSLFYALQGLNRMNKTGTVNQSPVIYGELALVYHELGQTENSLEWFKKALQAREDMKSNQIALFRTGGFVVQALIKLNKPKEALNEIRKLEKKYPPNSDYIKAIVYQLKGYCYDALKKYNMAEYNFLAMIKYFGGDKEDEIILMANMDIAKFYIAQKKYNKAASYLTGIHADSFMASRKALYNLMYFQIDSANHNYLSAINHLREYKTVSDSIFNEAKTKRIAELQIQYQTAQKETDIKLLKKDALLQGQRIVQSDKIRNLTLAVTILLLLLTGVLINSIRLNRRKNRSLNRLVQEKDELLIDKEWLLKEIHHRVKNNLQIVMGLLKRQSAYIDNDIALAAIQNSENRMHSIALIHQKLYQTNNIDLINLQEYIDELISYLKSSFDLGNRIYFEKQVDENYLDVSQAVPLGLILNEAITNAIKYAYPPDGTGSIKVSLLRLPDQQNCLTIADNGKGLPVSFDHDKVVSLGMSLMKGLSKQIGGKLKIDNTNGVTITVSFKTATPAREGRVSVLENYF